MKKFIKRLSFFFFLLFIMLVLKKVLTPYYIGNVYFKPKLEYFKENYKKEKFNTVFFGSSRIYRHVNSSLLDSLMGNEKIKSYNFATVGTYNPESYFLYDNFINNLNDTNIEYAFLELQSLNHLTEKNLTTTQGNYWNSIKYLSYSVNYILSTEKNKLDKLELIGKYVKSYFYSFFDVKIFKNYSMDTKNTKRRMGEQGFYTLDEDLRYTKNNRVLLQRNETFLSDTKVLEDRLASVQKLMSEKSDTTINAHHFKYLISLIQESKDKGVNLIFVLPPRLTAEEYLELIPISDLLPNENIIKLEDPNQFKELYMEEYSFDVGHMNAGGATFMTQYLAKGFKERL